MSEPRTGWAVADRGMVCGARNCAIGAGEAVRWVFGWPRCEACALRALGETAPDALEAPSAPGRLRLPATLERFRAPSAVDGRMRRLGTEG